MKLFHAGQGAAFSPTPSSALCCNWAANLNWELEMELGLTNPVPSPLD